MPAADALDAIYSMIIDEVGVTPEVPRFKVRERVDEVLNRPYDPEEAREYDLQMWALKNEQAAAAAGLDPDAEFESGPALAKRG
jgi:hypothetical protein